MKYQEIYCDLFDFEGKRDLVHCISADYKMGAGIAKEFTKRGVKDRLNTEYPFHIWNGHGYATSISEKDNHIVWNLITKKNYWDKPTYQSLVEALEDMKSKIITNDLSRQLAMPKIGCGLDRLKWDAVQPIIETIFDDTDFDIIVCYL